MEHISKNNKVFIFPGQGSQYVGMGKDLYENFSEAKQLYDTAEKILGFDIKRLCFEGPEEELKITKNTQPAIFIINAVLDTILKSKGLNPVVVAGHSLGEYSALYSASVFDFETGLKIVKKRGELMNEAKEGCMAAIIGLGDEYVQLVCQSIKTGVVVPANYNSPGQVVISGEKPAVEEAIKMAKEKGAKSAVMLKVSGAFHSPLMKSIASEFRDFLDSFKFNSPKLPVVANVTADYVKSESEIKELLYQQLFSPVLWTKSMQKLIDEGYKDFVEVGPGNVLKGLLLRINPSISITNIGKKSEIDSLNL